MFNLFLPMSKLGAHAEDRLAERTNLDSSVIKSLKKDLQKTPVPYGSHHVELEDGSYAVLKDVSQKGRKRHVVATVLAPHMSPPGTNITREFMQDQPDQQVYVAKSKGPNVSQEEGTRDIQRKNLRKGSFGATRNERLRDRLKQTQQKGDYMHKRIPGGFQSSESYSYSSMDKAASRIPSHILEILK